MGTKDRRERERQDTRDRILDAARELFVRDGVEAVTMRAIAERIEYTPTAIYHHFRDKDSLLRELCRTDMLALARAFQQIGKIADPVERLRKMGHAYVKFGLEHPEQYRFSFMTAHPKFRDAIEENNPEEDAYAFLEQTVAECIAAKRFKPEFTDAKQVAVMCWSATHGVLSLTINFSAYLPSWPDPYSTGVKAVDAMKQGLLREP